MRFRGGGVGHTSTRAATNVFKADRDALDIKSGQEYQDHGGAPDIENDDNDTFLEDSEPDEGDFSESEVVDYGYELEDASESGEEEEAGEDGEGGEEDDTTIDELNVLGYADY